VWYNACGEGSKLAMAWLIIRVVISVIASLILGYALLWSSWRLYYWHRLHLQRKRKNQVWWHYKHQQETLINELQTDSSLMPSALRTLQKWQEGEDAYLMIKRVWWQYQGNGASVFSQRQESARTHSTSQLLSDRMYHGVRGASDSTTSWHLYLTNRRLILISAQQELSLDLEQIHHCRFYYDSIEITLQSPSQRILLHNYFAPASMANCYQLLAEQVRKQKEES
jgi:hypothetical protein